MGGCQHPWSITFLPPPSPRPAGATWDLLTGNWTVTFDRPLTPGVIDPGNWKMNIGGTLYRGLLASAAGAVVSGTSQPSATGPGVIDTINYLPPPYDVIGVDLTPVIRFRLFSVAVS